MQDFGWRRFYGRARVVADDFNKPNLVVPLACSYNTRDSEATEGYYTADSGVDQRKVNFMYEVSDNPMTGKKTIVLAKRPGPDVFGTSHGTCPGLRAMLVWDGVFNTSQTEPWVFWVDTSTVKVNSNSIVTADTYAPAYVDTTLVSNTPTVVLQIRKDSDTAQRVFYASLINSWTEITDGDFTALVHRGKMEHMDGYAFIMDSNSFIYNSDLNSLANWSATNRIKKQIQQDIPVGLAKFKNQLVSFGVESAEVFYNAGNPSGSPLSRLSNLQAKIGLGASSGLNIDYPICTHYYCTIGNKMYFIGRTTPRRDDNVPGVMNALYMFDGSQFHKVSNDYADRLLNTVQFNLVETSTGPCSVFPFSVNGKTAVAIALTLPTAATQKWLMYFPEWNDWFEWNSTVFSPVSSGEWFICAGQSARAIRYGFENGMLWSDGNGTTFTAQVQFLLPDEDGSRKFMRWAGVNADTDPNSNNLSISFSDNDYSSFSTARTLDMMQSRKRIYRCGSYVKRAVKLSSTNTRALRISSFLARID